MFACENDPDFNLLVPQHEDARKLLTKYAHEKTYRLRDSLQEASASASEAAAPLPEFEPMDSTTTQGATLQP